MRFPGFHLIPTQPSQASPCLTFMNVKTSIAFLTSSSDPLLLNTCTAVGTALPNNPNFPTPDPTLAVINAAIADFGSALAAAAKGGSELISLKNQKRSALVGVFRKLASYLNLNCGGDLTKLLSSKFPIQKTDRTPAPLCAVPNVPAVTQGAASGSLDAATGAVTGALVYNWSLALASAPDAELASQQTTTASTTFAGLTPGQVYVVFVNATGTAGTSDWSQPGQWMVV